MKTLLLTLLILGTASVLYYVKSLVVKSKLELIENKGSTEVQVISKFKSRTKINDIHYLPKFSFQLPGVSSIFNFSNKQIYFVGYRPEMVKMAFYLKMDLDTFIDCVLAHEAGHMHTPDIDSLIEQCNVMRTNHLIMYMEEQAVIHGRQFALDPKAYDKFSKNLLRTYRTKIKRNEVL